MTLAATGLRDNEPIKCNRCGSTDFIKVGFNWRGGKKNVQRYRCRKCGKIFVHDSVGG